MRNIFNKLILYNNFTIILLGLFASTSIIFAQQKDHNIQGQYPNFFKVYSKDGSESFTTICTPLRSSPEVDKITCKFIQVRFEFPSREEDIGIPLSIEDALKNPSYEEEAKLNPKKFMQETKKVLEELMQDFCSPNSENRINIEKLIRDPKTGPKRKKYYQQLIESCSYKDPIIFYQSMMDFQRRTCDLYVDQFTLDFTKIRDGQWIFRQEKPGLLSNVFKIYELTGAGLLWTLSETRVPMEGSNEIPTKTIWSYENYSVYELPCDFISHKYIGIP